MASEPRTTDVECERCGTKTTDPYFLGFRDDGSCFERIDGVRSASDEVVCIDCLCAMEEV